MSEDSPKYQVTERDIEEAAALSEVLAKYIHGTVNRTDSTANCTPDIRFYHGIMGMISEVHEIEEAVGPFLNGEINGANFIEEAGDVLFYYALGIGNLVIASCPDIDELELLGHFANSASRIFENQVKDANKFEKKKVVISIVHQMFRSSSKLAQSVKRLAFRRAGNFANIASARQDAASEKAMDQISELASHAASMLAGAISLAKMLNPDEEVTLASIAKANSEKLQIRFPDAFSVEKCEGRDVAAEAKVFDPSKN